MASASVRYIVDDVDAAIGFYVDALGFTLEMHPAPSFAMLSRGDLRPGAVGARRRAGRRAGDARRERPQAGRLESLPAGGG